MSNCIRLSLAVLAVALVVVALPAAASAAISPTVTLTESGTAAGSSANVGLDINFAPSGTDSPKNLTVVLPPGLLANAAINGGACLTSTTLTSACQVGSGTATASPIVLNNPTVPVSIPVDFYLVPPPSSGDLAGVQVEVAGTGSALGPPADVTVRPSGNPSGVGLNMAFTNIPDTLGGLAQIGLDSLDSTFTGLRLPDSCPVSPADVVIDGSSYQDSTPRLAEAPLHVTACSALPYAPKFAVSATEDSGDSGVKVQTTITQKSNEATSRSTSLAFPSTVLAPNAAAVVNGGILCSDPTFATCKTVGSASTTSPLYPKPLTGKTYLTGSLSAPAITIRFPAPFALTLSGAVDLTTNTTTFTGLPDIPLTNLTVTLNGGTDAVFSTTCDPASGTASSTLTTTNGDKTVTDDTPFAISNCVASSSSSPGGGSSGSGSAGSKPSTGKRTGGRPSLTGGSVYGLLRAAPLVVFTARAGRNAPKLKTLLVTLPSGLDFVRHRVHRRLRVLGVTVGGGRIRSVSLQNGRLLIVLRSASARVTVKLAPKALRESLTLALRARRHHARLRTLTLRALLRDASGYATSVSLRIRKLHL